jgi:hypothetical protein
MSRSNASGHELPLEVILSLQAYPRPAGRQDDVDIFDGVAGQFDTVGYLNGLCSQPVSYHIISGVDIRVNVLIEQ